MITRRTIMTLWAWVSGGAPGWTSTSFWAISLEGFKDGEIRFRSMALTLLAVSTAWVSWICLSSSQNWTSRDSLTSCSRS